MARPARPADVQRLVEMYLDAADELSPMRGGRVLLGLNRREAPVATSFVSQLEDPRQFVVVAALGTDDIVGYGTCRTLEVVRRRAGRVDRRSLCRAAGAPGRRRPCHRCATGEMVQL